jgi:sugar phosphate isomerase/epimerase
MNIRRRDLLLAAPAVTSAALMTSTSSALGAPTVSTSKTIGPNEAGIPTGPAGARPGPVVFFSKFLPKLGPREMAVALKKIGYAGIDLTVRPGGHVEPGDVTKALPTAVEAIRAEGMAVPLVTTELLSAADPTARPIIATAGKLGVPLFKPGYFKYQYVDVRKELKTAGAQLKGLANLARESHIQMGFHNHGDCLGGPIWDAVQVIDGLDPRWAGYYLDTRHVFAEGGQSAWKVATHLVGPRVKAVSVKDFFWEKTAKGWVITKVPLGQGMVDLVGIFKILAAHKFAGPISIHLEYPIAGGDDAVLAAAARDRSVLETALTTVYGTA